VKRNSTLAPEEQHHWTGYPGAICIKCHRGDPIEIALADQTFDAYTGEWASEELQAQYLRDAICPVKGTLSWNASTKKWDLITVKPTVKRTKEEL
jgi:hypothetical protein